MRGNQHRWIHGSLLILFTGLNGCLIAQGEVALANDAEELLFQDETTGIPFNQLEEFTDYRQQPINLNRATRKQLAESGLFTPFQIEVLLAYRSKFGALLSVYELASLSGFRRSRVLDIAPYLTVGAGPVPSISNPQDLMFLFTVQRTFPEADGFIPLDTLRKAPAYSGTALKTWLRLKASLSSSFSAGLGYEKDPGEDFFHRGIPEFLSGYFMYRGTRHKQKLVLGNFRIHHGLGLVNGSQFISSVESHYHAFPPNSRIIPYAGLGEARFERGVGCQYAVGRLELMMWASHRPMDLSLHQIEEIPPRMDWEEAVRETGLHRTTSERSGRSLAFRFHQGVVASYRFPRLTLGAMCGWRINGLTTAGRDSLRSEEETFRCITGSINGSWYFGRFGLSWELAVTGDRSTALLAAFNYRLNDFMHGVVLIHRYGPDYRGMNPASYAAGSQLRNDRGVAFGWHIEAGRYFIADLKLELFRHEAPRYLADVPARSCRAVCTIKNSGLSDLHWRFRVYSKSWQRTIGSESPGIDPLINLKVIRSEIQFEYIPGRILPRQDGQLQRKSNNSATGNITKRHLAPPQWQSRLILSWHQESPLQCPDYALVQRLSLSAIDKLRGVLQVAIFHVTAWENRIYLHEPGLLYSFNFPVCDGMGEKVTGTLSTSIGNRITLSCKLGTTFYHDRDATGSGSERREGNKKWEAGLQIRMKL